MERRIVNGAEIVHHAIVVPFSASAG